MEDEQTVTNTICPYCGVGCELELHVQDNEIVKVTSPADHSVTNGHLCVKGRFGFQYVQNRGLGASGASGRRHGSTSLSQTSAGATGIVLAGGRSTRFGSDKLAALVDGVPLLHHPVLRLAEICREVLVVLAPGGEAPALPLAAPVRLVRDATEGEGPLAGVLAGLTETVTDWALVAGGDMPDLQTSVLLEMLRVAGEAGADAVALQDGERLRPLPLVLRSAPRARPRTPSCTPASAACAPCPRPCARP
jgi:molybdopterin-guanine dinucleotide biosynthesis protein A